MKTLIVFYSRHNHTKMVAEKIAKKIGAELELIVDKKDRSHLMSWFKSAFDEELRTPTKIGSLKKNPENYDLILIGTPVWDGIVPPVKEFLKIYKNKLKKVAFICTFGASAEDAFYVMEKICGKKPVATLELQDKEIVLEKDTQKVEDFCGKLK